VRAGDRPRRRVVRDLAAQGCSVVGFGEMGIGNTASASLITHCLTGVPLADCVGRGTGLDDAGLARKQALLEQALRRFPGGSPLEVLAEFGGFEIAAMVGAMLAAAEAKMVLLVDGFIVGAAALVAARLAPALPDYCVFCHCSANPATARSWRRWAASRCSTSACAWARAPAPRWLSPGPGGGRLPRRDGQLRIGRRRRQDMIRRELDAFLGAVGFFTRLPAPARIAATALPLHDAARYFPAVGLLVGGIGAAVCLLALNVWPQPVAVLLAMAATLLATGAFHEDGLSDTADGLGGGWDKARILAIMKDSRIGSYGVVALWLALSAKFALLSGLDAALLPWALLAATPCRASLRPCCWRRWITRATTIPRNRGR
jgi:hypothetical protein